MDELYQMIVDKLIDTKTTEHISSLSCMLTDKIKFRMGLQKIKPNNYELWMILSEIEYTTRGDEECIIHEYYSNSDVKKTDIRNIFDDFMIKSKEMYIQRYNLEQRIRNEFMQFMSNNEEPLFK
jgi:hypothetical protein